MIRLPKGSYVPQIEIRVADGDTPRWSDEAPRAPRGSSPKLTRMRPWLVPALAAVSLAGAAFWSAGRKNAASSQPLVRLDVDLGQGEAIGTQVGSASAVLSPDGRRIVFISFGPDTLPHLVMRRLDQPEASEIVELPGTQGARGPFFSPDGEWVAFWAAGKLKKIRVEGGTPVNLCDVPDLLGGTWGEDGKIVGSSGRDLWIVSATGGPPKSLAPRLMGSWPQYVPGSPLLLYAAGAYTSMESGTYEVYVRAFPDNGSVRQVSAGGGTQAIWAGHKLFYRSNDNRIMMLGYHTESGQFLSDGPLRWSDVQIGDTGVLPNFDVSTDAKHLAVLMPAAGVADQQSRTRVTFVLHFADLLRQRLARP